MVRLAESIDLKKKGQSELVISDAEHLKFTAIFFAILAIVLSWYIIVSKCRQQRELILNSETIAPTISKIEADAKPEHGNL